MYTLRSPSGPSLKVLPLDVGKPLETQQYLPSCAFWQEEGGCEGGGTRGWLRQAGGFAFDSVVRFVFVCFFVYDQLFLIFFSSYLHSLSIHCRRAKTKKKISWDENLRFVVVFVFFQKIKKKFTFMSKDLYMTVCSKNKETFFTLLVTWTTVWTFSLAQNLPVRRTRGENWVNETSREPELRLITVDQCAQTVVTGCGQTVLPFFF